MNAQQITESFTHWNLHAGYQAYVRHHARRYAFLLQLAGELLSNLPPAGPNQKYKILDIGPAYQTELLQNLRPNLLVNSVGFPDDRIKYRPGEKHIQFDLNEAQFREKWPVLEEHDMITMCEVIEHLYTSPKLVLQCAARWLKPGGWFIIQTPNAVSLQRRIKLLVGLNPYEMIRDQRENPGHFREYTVKELIAIAREAGLDAIQYDLRNYFDFESIFYRGYNALSVILPPGLRAGITICLRKGVSPQL